MPDVPGTSVCMRADILKRLDQLRLIDDDFFSQALDGRTEAVGYIVNTILERDDIRVISTKSQVERHSTSHRTIKLDIEARDAEGRVLDIEIQRADHGSGVRRARFHSSMLDQTMLEKGQDFEALAESYVIFITEKDKYGAGLPVYHINRTVQELDYTPFGDGSHILYVNGEFQDTTHPIGQLMHDFHQSKASEIESPLLAEEVRYMKESEGGRGKMCKVLEDMCYEYETKARMETCLENARKMLLRGKLTHEEIAADFGLSLEKVNELAKSIAQ